MTLERNSDWVQILHVRTLGAPGWHKSLTYLTPDCYLGLQLSSSRGIREISCTDATVLAFAFCSWGTFWHWCQTVLRWGLPHPQTLLRTAKPPLHSKLSLIIRQLGQLAVALCMHAHVSIYMYSIALVRVQQGQKLLLRMLLYSENPCHLIFTGGIIIIHGRHFLVIVIYSSVIIIENAIAKTAGNMTEKQVHFFQVGDL